MDNQPHQTTISPPPAPPKPSFWQRKLWKLPIWGWILIAVIVSIGVIGTSTGGGSSNRTASTDSTPTTQPTSAPTHAPTKASTPTPQVSIQDQVQSIAQKSGASYSGDASVTYDSDFKYAYVVETFPTTGDNGLNVSRIKHDSLVIQKAIWQAHVKGIDAVQVIFNSNNTGVRIATCEVEQTTAATLKWSTLSSNQAWLAYDSTWLSPNLT